MRAHSFPKLNQVFLVTPGRNDKKLRGIKNIFNKDKNNMNNNINDNRGCHNTRISGLMLQG